MPRKSSHHRRRSIPRLGQKLHFAQMNGWGSKRTVTLPVDKFISRSNKRGRRIVMAVGYDKQERPHYQIVANEPSRRTSRRRRPSHH